MPILSGSRPWETAQLAHLVDAALAEVVGLEVGQPAVTELRGPADRGLRDAADPDRDRPLHRQRVDAAVLDAVEGAFIGDEIGGPEFAQHVDLLVRPLAAIGEDLAAGLELLRLDADTDPEAEPPAGQHVDLRRLLGDQRGAAHRQDKDTGHQLDPAGDGGEIAEQDEDLVEHVLGVMDILQSGRLFLLRPMIWSKAVRWV